ncbi:MAG: zf-HC2 domain-containing protein [Pirellulales bacterium]|nr:zf-HC2 domain-containing protein [Pirellulales bacterium]
MTCEELVGFLADYLDGQLPAETRALFETHLAVCPPCVEFLKSYGQTVRVARAALCGEGHAPPTLPEDLVQAILASRPRP